MKTVTRISSDLAVTASILAGRPLVGAELKAHVAVVKKAIEDIDIALAEQEKKATDEVLQWVGQQEQPLISADEARKLGAGNFEARCDNGEWRVGTQNSPYRETWNGEVVKYQAIKQPKPTEFKRENRYIVLKNKDVAKLSLHQRQNLRDVQDSINSIRACRSKSELECVVVESDDKAYEQVWKLIEQVVQPEPTCQIKNLDTGVTESGTK